MVSVEIASATRPAVIKRIELVKVINRRLFERSTMRPIGIAKSSQGNITNALSSEISTGSFVSEIASSGAATARSPSERLLITLALKSRLKAGPNFSDIYLSAYRIPATRNHLLGFIRPPCAFKIWMNPSRRFQNIVQNFP